MSKVKPFLPRPVAAARRVLAECGVHHPRDIHVEAMAARYGAMIVYGPLDTARGSIVRTAQRAVIWIDAKAKGQPRADFTTAHELGHHLLHEVVDHFAQCDGEAASSPPRGGRDAREAAGRARAVEQEANHFSVELLMPEEWAAPLCDVGRPSLDDVYRLTQAFGMSLHASALRFVELAAAPCAFVHTLKGRIKRSSETLAFPGQIVQRRPVHERSVAARLQDRRPGGEEAPEVVPGAAWGDVGGPGFLEQTIVLGPELGVLSWLVPLT